jgi:hypothetical protein
VTKGQGVRAVNAFVIGRTVVQESTNAAALLEKSIGVQYDDTGKYAHVRHAYQSRVQSRRTCQQYKCWRYQSGTGHL